MSFYDNDNEEDEFMDDEEETDMFAPASRLAKLASASETKVPLPRGNSSSNNNNTNNHNNSNNHNSNSISGSSNSNNNSSIGGGNFSDLSALPSMRGSMRKEGNAVVCRGAWALSDASHGMQHQTSDFEFSLVEAFDPSAFPSSGNYVGWFMLKQPYGKSKRIVDSNMILNFNSSDGGIEYTVAGEGQNEFGRYYLRGKFSLTNHALHIYREYMPLPALGAQSAAASKPLRSASSTSNASVERSTSVSSSGRVRKVKKIDYDDEDEDFEENADGDEAYSSPRVKKASAKVVATNTLPRAVSSNKLEPSMQKCMSLLRDVSGLKSAYFFLEPVDPIKLNIPNYPQIVTHPMDIRTVRENLEAGFYDTPAAFADHMRLIFANAIKFNHTKDHIVNIAARELSAKFEEKFRKMHESSSSSSSSSVKESKAKSTANKYNKYDDDLEDEVYQDDFGEEEDDEEDFVGLGKRSKSKAPRPSRASSAHMAPAPAVSRSASSSSNNNRVSSFSSIDPKDALLNELARKVQQMEQEVVFLRTQVSKQEVKSQLEKQKEAAQTPLSTEEKKTLIDAIGQLSEERLEWVIETVRASLPPHKRSEEEIEIEIDVLDTMTLRKLQDYISGGDGRPAKKPKKETKKQQLQQQQQMMQQQQLAQRPSLPKMNSSSNNNYNNNNNNNSQYNHQDDLLGGDDALFQFDPDEEDEFGGEEIKSGTIERSVSSNAVNLAKEREREQSRELAAERYRQQQEALREEERKKREAMLRNQQSGAGGMDEDDEDDVDMF